MTVQKLIVFALLPAALALSAPIQWTPESGGNGHWYDLTATQSTWTEASATALAAGGYLATIVSAEEDAFLASRFTGHLWIGLTDAVEGNYVWVTGEAVTYTNWQIGEPNNGFPCCAPDEDYSELIVLPGEIPGWNDLPNAGPGFLPIHGIIEFDENPIPEPATMLLSGVGLLTVLASRYAVNAIRSDSAHQS